MPIKALRNTTMPLSKKRNGIQIPTERLEIFADLIHILKPYEHHLNVRVHTTTRYELWTEHIYRTSSFRPQNRQGILFAGIAICTTHVGFYFYPLHINNELKNNLTEGLRKLLKGKSAFHFRHFPEPVQQQLKALIYEGWLVYEQFGWTKRK